MATPTSSIDPADAAKASASSAVHSLSKAIASASAALSSEKCHRCRQRGEPSCFQVCRSRPRRRIGILIGSSFVFKKKGLLAAQKKYETAAGEGHAYLKSPMWWTGMIVMVFGEVFNFVAYAFADAVLVTPLGALSVVICAVSLVDLPQREADALRQSRLLSSASSVPSSLRSTHPHLTSRQDHRVPEALPCTGLLGLGSVCIVSSLVLIFVFAPKYGKQYMMNYITVCSLIGGLSVSVTSGLGSAILLSIRGPESVQHWFIYSCSASSLSRCCRDQLPQQGTRIVQHGTVTPTYYVIFTGATLNTSIILQQGLNGISSPDRHVGHGLLGHLRRDRTAAAQQDRSRRAARQAWPGSRYNPLDSRQSFGHLPRRRKVGCISVRGSWPGHGARRYGHCRLDEPCSQFKTVQLGQLLETSQCRRRVQRCAGRNNLPLTTHGAGDIERFQLQDAPLSPRGNATLTVPGTPSRRGTAISFEAGADAPHGHHAGEASPTTVTQFGAIASPLHAIREASDGSGRTTEASSSANTGPRRQGSAGTYIDPYAPRQHSPLSPTMPRSEGAPNLGNVWGTTQHGILFVT